VLYIILVQLDTVFNIHLNYVVYYPSSVIVVSNETNCVVLYVIHVQMMTMG